MRRVFYRGYYTNKRIRNTGCYNKYKHDTAIFYVLDLNANDKKKHNDNCCYKYNNERSHELCGVCSKRCNHPEPVTSHHFGTKSLNKLKGNHKKTNKWLSYLGSN